MSHMSHNESHLGMVGHVTHKSHVKFISFNATMLNGSLGEEGEGGKTALIDQRAVAAGKNKKILHVRWGTFRARVTFADIAFTTNIAVVSLWNDTRYRN